MRFNIDLAWFTGSTAWLNGLTAWLNGLTAWLNGSTAWLGRSTSWMDSALKRTHHLSVQCHPPFFGQDEQD